MLPERSLASSSKVAVTIFAHSSQLSAVERINLSQCRKILNDHPIFLVCPKGLDTKPFTDITSDLILTFVPKEYLCSLRSYNRFKISRYLYDCFSDYDFMLTYELDAFVFRDELQSWCEKGYDFVGAPWFEGFVSASNDAKPIFGCNSGFSLRKINSCKRVLSSLRHIEPLNDIYRRWRETDRPTIRGYYRLLRSALVWNLYHDRFNRYSNHEDLFWTIHTPRAFSWFRVAEYETARAFSFEWLARRLYKENENKLPFGCHKWHVYDLDFWRPHIESFGYDLSFLRPESQNQA